MKKAILIVSFGTTYPDTRQKNIAAITRQVRALYPDAVVEEAVSSTIVRNAMKKREHIEAKSPTEALESMKKQGVTHVAVFPTHVIDEKICRCFRTDCSCRCAFGKTAGL